MGRTGKQHFTATVFYVYLRYCIPACNDIQYVHSINNIRIERAIKGLTQEDVVKKVSVSRQTINAMELNKYVPSTVLALKIAKIFNRPVEDIFILEDTD